MHKSIYCNSEAFKLSNASLTVSIATKFISQCVLKVGMTFWLFYDAEARTSKITNIVEASECCMCTLLVQSALFTYFQIWSKSRENRAKIKKNCVRRRFSQRRVDEIGRELLFWRNLFWVVLASVQRPRDQNTSAAGLCFQRTVLLVQSNKTSVVIKLETCSGLLKAVEKSESRYY